MSLQTNSSDRPGRCAVFVARLELGLRSGVAKELWRSQEFATGGV